FAITIEVCHGDHSPVNGQSWSQGAADKSIVIEVPDRCLPSSGGIQHIIGLAVRVEIAHSYKIPTVRKSRAEGAANKVGSRQIPDRRARQERCFYLKREVLVRSASPLPYVGARCYA